MVKLKTSSTRSNRFALFNVHRVNCRVIDKSLKRKYLLSFVKWGQVSPSASSPKQKGQVSALRQRPWRFRGSGERFRVTRFFVWGRSKRSFRVRFRLAVLPSSDLGFQQLQEQFVHWDFAVLLDAVEVLHGLGGGLAEQGEGHEQLARPAGVLLVLGGLVVLQGLVEHILELLHCVHVFDGSPLCLGVGGGLLVEDVARSKLKSKMLTLSSKDSERYTTRRIKISIHALCSRLIWSAKDSVEKPEDNSEAEEKQEIYQEGQDQLLSLSSLPTLHPFLLTRVLLLLLILLSLLCPGLFSGERQALSPPDTASMDQCWPSLLHHSNTHTNCRYGLKSPAFSVVLERCFSSDLLPKAKQTSLLIDDNTRVNKEGQRVTSSLLQLQGRLSQTNPSHSAVSVAHKKGQEEARGRVRVLYLLLTNEPSSHKEWAREERREGVRKGEEKESGGEEIMPTFRHFMKRQAWHDLRLLLVISHSLVAGQLYSMLPLSSLLLFTNGPFDKFILQTGTKREMERSPPPTFYREDTEAVKGWLDRTSSQSERSDLIKQGQGKGEGFGLDWGAVVFGKCSCRLLWQVGLDHKPMKGEKRPLCGERPQPGRLDEQRLLVTLSHGVICIKAKQRRLLPYSAYHHGVGEEAVVRRVLMVLGGCECGGAKSDSGWRDKTTRDGERVKTEEMLRTEEKKGRRRRLRGRTRIQMMEGDFLRNQQEGGYRVLGSMRTRKRNKEEGRERGEEGVLGKLTKLMCRQSASLPQRKQRDLL
ncbi:hypothetical protein F7725_026125 [Dissostichus mawsoni]|uniref:Uncharacterized protein n=1 Tax=Dissostichus mawsoni TaxID=36200 RepID=A0A7J5X657_DISMA|nr:hypothetical protein F7725_026125 [Dissostichus mawsoni]